MVDLTGAGTARLSGSQTAGFAISMFLIGSFFLALSPILLDVARDLGARPEQYGHPGAAYGFALAATSIVFAPFHDVLPRRSVLLGGMALHATGIVLATLAPGWPALVAGHGLCGVGGGIFAPAAYATVSDRTADNDRARILGRVNIGWAGSTLLGVPAAALAASVFGWRAAMAGLAVLWLVVAVLIIDILRDPGPRQDRPRGNIWDSTAWTKMGQARLPALYLATVLIFVGFYGVYAFLGVAIRGGLGVAASDAGVFVSIYGAGFLLGTLNGWVIDRIGPFRVLLAAAAVLGAVLCAIPFSTSAIGVLAVVLFLWGIAQNAAFTSISAIISACAPAIRARAFSFNTACVFLGSSIGTASMGYVLAAAGFRTVGVLCMLSSWAAAWIVWRLILRR